MYTEGFWGLAREVLDDEELGRLGALAEVPDFVVLLAFDRSLQRVAERLTHRHHGWNERILAGSQGEDRPSGVRARHGEERGRPYFRGEPLLGEALRRYGEDGEVPRPEEETRLQDQARRACQEASGEGRGGTPLSHALREARIPEGGGRGFGEQFDGVPRVGADGAHAQKGGVKAGERDEFLRAAWRVLVAGEFDLGDFVFVDECGTHTSLAPVHGYSPRGERVYLETPRNRGKNTTLLASMSIEGMGECLAVEGATTKVIFETYVERVLAPSLRAGQVVVMDNLSAHKGE